MLQIKREILDITQNTMFQKVRETAEREARKLLNDKSGNFSEDDFLHFFDLCNTELIPAKRSSIMEKSLTRFGLCLKGDNRNRILKSIDASNEWINELWTSGNKLSVLSEFWKQKEVSGVGIGLPTIILYLKNPEDFNVWLPFLHKAVVQLNGKALPMRRNIKDYILYNNFINDYLRIPLKLMPLEIDYILSKV